MGTKNLNIGTVIIYIEKDIFKKQLWAKIDKSGYIEIYFWVNGIDHEFIDEQSPWVVTTSFSSIRSFWIRPLKAKIKFKKESFIKDIKKINTKEIQIYTNNDCTVEKIEEMHLIKEVI